jgi:hypothetical protein
MNRIPYISVGVVAPLPEVIRKIFGEQTDQMVKVMQNGNKIYIRLDWGVMVDSLQNDPYLGTE